MSLFNAELGLIIAAIGACLSLKAIDIKAGFIYLSPVTTRPSMKTAVQRGHLNFANLLQPSNIRVR